MDRVVLDGLGKLYGFQRESEETDDEYHKRLKGAVLPIVKTWEQALHDLDKFVHADHGNPVINPVVEGPLMPSDVTKFVNQLPVDAADQIRSAILNDYSPAHRKLLDRWMENLSADDHPFKNAVRVWVRESVPSKKNGRKGTRKGWKKLNAPGWRFIPQSDLVMMGLPEVPVPPDKPYAYPKAPYTINVSVHSGHNR